MKNRLVSAFYFLLCALEGLVTLVSLWFTPANRLTDPTIRLSLGRAGLLLLTGLFTLFFAGLSSLEYRRYPGEHSPLQRLFGQPGRFLLLVLVCAFGLLGVYLAVFSPLRSSRLLGYYQRWQPFFVWWLLVFIQLLGAALLLRGPVFWQQAWQAFFHNPRAVKVSRQLSSPVAGAALLALSVLVGLSKLYFGRFVDEGDNLAVGWLLTQGYTLYQDVFSHHFPFPYYWVALVVRLFGNSFPAARLSLLLLQVGVFAACMACTRLYFPLGLASLSWNLVNQFYRGHELIYASFEGIFLLGVFALVFKILDEDLALEGSPPTTRFGVRRLPAALALAGLFSGLALLSDPLAIYPLGVAFLALFISGRSISGRTRWREGLRRVALAAGAASLVVGIFALQLLLSRSGAVFFRDTFWFNAEIYTKYVDANPNRLGAVAHQVVTGLGITNLQWFRFPSPFLPLEPYRSVSLADENTFYSWLFTGFWSRLAILACAIGFTLQRKYLTAGFLYLFSAALLVRAEAGIYTIGFTLVSLLAAFILITQLSSAVERLRFPSPGMRTMATGAWRGTVVLIGLMAAWSAFRGGFFLADYWNIVQDPSHVKMYGKFGDGVRQLTCNQLGVRLAVFPVNPIIYFVTEIPPATRYTFMYPWVAEVGQQEVISELRKATGVVVLMNADRKADSREGAATYMADTIRFLDEEYISVGGELWVSPDIPTRCPAAASETQVQP